MSYFGYKEEKKHNRLRSNLKTTLIIVKRFFGQVLEDIKLRKRPNVNVIVRLADVIFLLFEYPVIILLFVTGLFGPHRIWSSLHLPFAFLPGLAWYSYTNLVCSKNRLSWFLSSLCFPGFVAWARVSFSF